MATAERTAEVTWEGALARGDGSLALASGATDTLPITWASRTERSDGKTSPEELIAAAHAGCYAMAFSFVLGEADTPPERLHVTATVALDAKDGGGFEITSSRLSVTGSVPGLDQAGFERAAAEAEQGCPVSNALRGNVEITVEAALEG